MKQNTELSGFIADFKADQCLVIADYCSTAPAKMFAIRELLEQKCKDNWGLHPSTLNGDIGNYITLKCLGYL